MKIAFSGTHGTGKTTSVFDYAKKMKMQHPEKTVGVFCENAKHSPYLINKQTTPQSQLWIFTNQIQEELSLSTKYDILVTDRSFMDAVAYTKVAGFEDLASAMYHLAILNIHSYDTIFFKKLISNEYLVSDGVREANDTDFRRKVEEELLFYYRRAMRVDSRFSPEKFIMI